MSLFLKKGKKALDLIEETFQSANRELGGNAANITSSESKIFVRISGELIYEFSLNRTGTVEVGISMNAPGYEVGLLFEHLRTLRINWKLNALPFIQTHKGETLRGPAATLYSQVQQFASSLNASGRFGENKDKKGDDLDEKATVPSNDTIN